MSPTQPGGSGGFLARNLRRLLVGAVIGALIGGVLALRSPSGFEATTQVLITRLAVDGLDENSLDATAPLLAEIRFAQSGNVRDVVRGAIPTAPSSIRVEPGDANNVLEFIAGGDTETEAVRLSRNWATTYIAQRQVVLIESWTDRADLVESELDQLVTDLGTARLAGDDATAARLEERRDVAATEGAAAQAALQALRGDPGAELFGPEPEATPTGLSLAATPLLGAVLGTLVAAAFVRMREQRVDDQAEATSWMHQADEGNLAPVLTTGTLDVPSFLDPDSSLASLAPSDGSGAGAPLPPVTHPELAPERLAAAYGDDTAFPWDDSGETAKSANGAVTAPATAAAHASPRIVDAKPAPTGQRTATATPLRIANIDVKATATRRPVLNRADQVWADDISLTTDA